MDSDMPELRLHRHHSTNPFLKHSHEEINLMKRQLTFHNLITLFDEVDVHYLMKSFSLLSQNSWQEKNILNQYISQ
jgi:hypothetical protein